MPLFGHNQQTKSTVELLSNNLQSLMMIAGISIICWLLMRSKMVGKKRAELPVNVPSLKHNANAQVTHRGFSGTNSLGAPTEVLKWQVELHDLGRELKAELDSKLIAVRSMTLSYDRAAQRLSELIRMAEQVTVSPQSPLAEARRLSAQDWPNSKIATAIGISEEEVQQLLGIQRESD
jgi:hypothetical protein